MRTAAILLRVSTEQQSMESQKVEVLKAVTREGFEVPEKYVFGQKITGRDNVRKEDRQSIKDLKAACLEGEIEAIFICEVSRLSRNSIAGRLYVQEFTDMNIPIYFNDVSMWTLDKDTKIASPSAAYISMFFDIAATELSTFKSRSMRGRKQNARTGLVTGGYLKYGYKKEPITKKLVINEEEADFVRDLCTKYATGEYSIRRLTIYANSTNTPTRYQKDSKKVNYSTKGGITRKISSITWTTTTIRSMLSESIYIGKRMFGDEVQEVPAIISEDLFNEVQARLKSNPKYLEKSKHTHLLQKILHCGVCNGLYFGSYKERSNAYLCSAYTRAAINCNNTSLNYERAESIIWDYVKNQTYFFKQINEEEKIRLIEIQTTKRENLVVDKQNYEVLKNKESIKIKNLVNLVVSGTFIEEDIAEQRKVIDSNIKSYTTEIDKIDEELRLINNRINNISNQNLTGIAILNIESDRKLMKEKIKEVIDRIFVFKLNERIALLQVHYLDKIYNILYNYRKQADRYYFIENDVATFNNPKSANQLNLPVDLLAKLPEFTVTSSNNNVFDGDVFGDYSGVDLIRILEKNNQYRDYDKFEKIIPQKLNV